MVLIGRTLQVEGVLTMVHDFEHGHVVGSLLARVELLLEAALGIIVLE